MPNRPVIFNVYQMLSETEDRGVKIMIHTVVEKWRPLEILEDLSSYNDRHMFSKRNHLHMHKSCIILPDNMSKPEFLTHKCRFEVYSTHDRGNLL